MGMVRFGIPEKITLELRDLSGATVFIETGTYQGDTARWAANHFDRVITIERSKSLFDEYSEGLANLHNVSALCGDSRQLLPSILEEIGEEKALFWLDSHWFGGETAGQDDQCPLLGELACLKGRRGDVLLVDDARLFLAAPPMPHDVAQWPDIGQVIRALPNEGKELCVQVADDVIFVTPDIPPINTQLLAYTKRRNNLFWQEYTRSHRYNTHPQ